MTEKTGEILKSINQQEPGARALLFSHLSERLRKIVKQKFRDKITDTMCPTAVVNEFYMRFADCKNLSFENTARFHAYSLVVMKNVINDYWKERRRDKRGGFVEKISADEMSLPGLGNDPDLMIAYCQLRDSLPDNEGLVKKFLDLHFLEDRSVRDIAQCLQLTEKQVYRMIHVWSLWLRTRMNERPPKSR